MQNNSVLTVSQLTGTIKRLLETHLSEMWVEGEISNFKHHSSGHMYFSLKDSQAQIRCVMFRGKNSYLKFRPANGNKVRIRGTVGVWPPQGSYQFYVEEMLPSGIGALHQAFEQLKARLQREGLFDAQHKKEIPLFPRCVGVVTSATGAAIKDIVNVISRRYPLVNIVLCPARVQGEDAAREIAVAIKTFDRMNPDYRPDVLIVGRGGGSIEDLWPFNEEITARAIYNCSIPVISAVGHEIDFTIADFVADLRAPTPSAGAEEAVPNQEEIRSGLTAAGNQLYQSMKNSIRTNSLQLDRLGGSMLFKPQMVIREAQMNLDMFESRFTGAWINRKHIENRQLEIISESLKSFNLDKFRHKLNLISAELNGQNPKAILRKGYAICCGKDGSIISSVQDVSLKDAVEIELGDGILNCIVNDRRMNNDRKQK